MNDENQIPRGATGPARPRDPLSVVSEGIAKALAAEYGTTLPPETLKAAAKAALGAIFATEAARE